MDQENATLFCRHQMGMDEYVLWRGRPSKKGNVLVFLFPLAGVGVMVGMLCKSFRFRNCTEYVITNKRVCRRMGKRMDNYTAAVAKSHELKYHRNGNATIRFFNAIDYSAGHRRYDGRLMIPVTRTLP